MRISDRKLVLKVSLRGKRFRVSEDAIIDTGASFSVIPPEIADFLELEVDRSFPRARLVTASGVIETSVKVLPELEVAGIKVENLRVVIHKIPDPAPVKILLGMNFIEKINLEIDGKNNSFEIRDP
jgi:predicted aspartyl protease